MNPDHEKASIPESCPVCGAPVSRAEERSYSAAIAAMQFCPPRRDPGRNRQVQEAIERLWQGEDARMFLCRKCGFGFPVPRVSGDEAFYALLHEDTAYPVWRWEYGVALLEVEDTTPGATVLDIGAGDGAFLRRLPSTWHKWAIEASPAMRSALGAGNVRVVADAREAPRNAFDVVTMFQVLEHLTDHRAVFDECLRLLKPGGHLYVSVPDGERIREWARVTGLPDMPPFHVAQWTAASLGRALAAAGFVDVRLAHDPWSFTNVATLLGNSLRAVADRDGAFASRMWSVTNRKARRALFAAAAVLYAPRLARVAMVSPVLGRDVVLLVRATRPGGVMATAPGTTASPTGREQFAGKYEHNLAWETAWLRAGAGMKVDAVQQLLYRAGVRPQVLAELGCGVGAVIEECRRRGLADGYAAVDSSGEAIAALRAADPDIQAVVADITAAGFRAPASADVVLASHVLEHLEEPERCLVNIRCSSGVRHAVLEVPLEGLVLGRLKAALLGARRDTSAGHVQLFSRQTFERLVRSSGFMIVDRELYAPVMSAEAMDLLQVRKGWPRWKRALKELTLRRLPAAAPALWSRFYHAHYAVLVTPDPAASSRTTAGGTPA